MPAATTASAHRAVRQAHRAQALQGSRAAVHLEVGHVGEEVQVGVGICQGAQLWEGPRQLLDQLPQQLQVLLHKALREAGSLAERRAMVPVLGTGAAAVSNGQQELCTAQCSNAAGWTADLQSCRQAPGTCRARSMAQHSNRERCMSTSAHHCTPTCRTVRSAAAACLRAAGHSTRITARPGLPQSTSRLASCPAASCAAETLCGPSSCSPTAAGPAPAAHCCQGPDRARCAGGSCPGSLCRGAACNGLCICSVRVTDMRMLVATAAAVASQQA